MEINPMRRRLEILLLAGLILGTAAARDRSVEQDTTASWLGTVPAKVAGGMGMTIGHPRLQLHWAATGLGVLATLPLDNRVRQRAVERGLMPESLARLGETWGGGWAALAILPGIYLAETLRGATRQETFRRLEFAGLSLSAVGVTTQLLKWATGRKRPNGANRQSFPSGHTSAAFGVAEVVRTLYGNRPGAVFYSLALVTGLSRINDNKHYLSDVVAGAGLGIGLVRGFGLALRPTGRESAVQVTVAPGRVIVGLRL